MILNPHLPGWLPEVTVENLRVGRARATIEFWRQPDGSTQYRVVALEGKLRIVRQPNPVSLTAVWAERVKDALFSLVRAA